MAAAIGPRIPNPEEAGGKRKKSQRITSLALKSEAEIERKPRGGRSSESGKNY